MHSRKCDRLPLCLCEECFQHQVVNALHLQPPGVNLAHLYMTSILAVFSPPRSIDDTLKILLKEKTKQTQVANGLVFI